MPAAAAAAASDPHQLLLTSAQCHSSDNN